MFDDHSLSTLCGLISNCPTLSSLSLSRCNLTKNIFQSDRYLFTSVLKTSKLVHLDVSHNNMMTTGLEMLLTCLPLCLHHLELTGCNLHSSSSTEPMFTSLLQHCSQGTPDTDLCHLTLASMSLTDTSLSQLTPCLQYCGRLSVLDLDHNLVTVTGVVTLLDSLITHHVPLTKLRCAASQSQAQHFWDNKCDVPDFLERFENLLNSNCSRLELLVLPHHNIHSVHISKLWDEKYYSRSKRYCDGNGNTVYCVQ